MKINDITDPLNEGIGSFLFGDVAAAKFKGMFNGQGAKKTLEKSIFVKDFVNDAIASLKSGIKSGIVAKKTPVQSTAQPSSTSTNPPVIAETFDKLDAVFESYIAEASGTNVQSISEFLLDWFRMYMHGVYWTSRQTQVEEILDNIEKSYPNIKPGINQLAQAAYALSKTSPIIPKGAENMYGTTTNGSLAMINMKLAKGVTVVNTSPTIFEFNKKTYIQDGESDVWVNMKSNKPVSKPLSDFLNQQEKIVHNIK